MPNVSPIRKKDRKKKINSVEQLFEGEKKKLIKGLRSDINSGTKKRSVMHLLGQPSMSSSTPI